MVRVHNIDAVRHDIRVIWEGQCKAGQLLQVPRCCADTAVKVIGQAVVERGVQMATHLANVHVREIRQEISQLHRVR